MIKFEKYEATSTLEDLGTLAKVIGTGGTLSLLPKNLRSTKRVVVIAKNKTGESAVISCSSGVSDSIRKAIGAGKSHKQVLGAISKLNVLENEEGVAYICAPAGEGVGLEEFTVADLKSVTVNYEELVAL